MEIEILNRLFDRNQFDFLSINSKKMVRFLNILYEKNKVMNLVGKGEWKDLVETHTRESLEFFHALPLEIINNKSIKVLDIGSGGGFPGIIIGISKPEWTVHLVESIGKKANFLTDVLSELNLSNVFVHHTRAEELARDKNYYHQFSLVMARGVGKYNYLYPLFKHFIKKNGQIIFWKKEEEIKPYLKEYPAKIVTKYLYPISSGQKSILVLSI